MNKTELKAFKWLQAQGKAPIFQSHKSPDFVCPDGTGYEVKLKRENSITFSKTQIEPLKEFPGLVTVLVFNEGEEPLFVIPFNELRDESHYWKHLRITVYDYRKYAQKITNRGIDPELYKQAKADAVLRDISIGQWIDQAFRDALQK